MCGRFTLTVTMEELLAYYLLDGPTDFFHIPRFNIAPTQQVAAVIHDGTRNRIGLLRWGLVPGWAEDDAGGSKLINARAETIAEKPSFRPLFYRKRCVIPADGFYEWKTLPDGRKQPMRIVLNDRTLFSFAGLYDTWVRPDGVRLSTCTIVTTAPNRFMADIHRRMPAILQRDEEALWLDRTNADAERLKRLLRPYPEERMEAYAVSPVVGKSSEDSEMCIRPVKDGNSC